jgi:hypothetical protein
MYYVCDMEKIYVVCVSSGYGDDWDKEIIYAGIDYDTAKQRMLSHEFYDEHNNNAYIQTWIDGNVRNVEYREDI